MVLDGSAENDPPEMPAASRWEVARADTYGNVKVTKKEDPRPSAETSQMEPPCKSKGVIR